MDLTQFVKDKMTDFNKGGSPEITEYTGLIISEFQIVFDCLKEIALEVEKLKSK